MAPSTSQWCCLAIGILSFLLNHCQSLPIDYNNTGGPVKGKLNVHLVPHTHDDLGWLKTVDQYYVGSNSSIQAAAVQYILDSVVAALRDDPNKKFIYVESGFFARWWREQNEKKKKIVRNLVASGQFEFINGGYVMHDEATTIYMDMIDQTSLGHRFLKKEFGIVPRTGWQIDPFGHSVVQAYLLTAEVGFDALFFGRADYQDIANRREQRTMEMVWHSSNSFGTYGEVFTGILPNLYMPPDDFNFGIATTESVIQDDPLLYDFNVEEMIDKFVYLAREQAKDYRTNHIIWTMGEDFQYESAGTWFKQMDKLIHYVNKDGRVNAFYSTPTIYTEEKYASNESWPLKTGDFFPYADYSNAYWTGYFTSRPALKGYVRKLSGFLQAARQLEFLVGRNEGGPNTDSLEEAMAILQHHDAVSGTSKQHVANDYAKRLSRGSVEAESVMNLALLCLMSGKSNNNCGDKIPTRQRTHSEHPKGSLLQEEDSMNTLRQGLNLAQCSLMNISYCPESEADLGDGRSTIIVIYNPLGWKRNEVVRIPVTNSALDVLDSDGNRVQAQIVSIDAATRRVRNFYTEDISPPAGPLFNLFFEASVPALGYTVYFLKAAKNGASWTSFVKPEHTNGEVTLDSNKIQMVFSNSTGLLMEIRNPEYRIAFPVHQSFCWYNASDGNTNSGQNGTSGAYIFRPNSTRCFPVGASRKQVTQSVIKGEIVSEVYQQFSPWVSQVVRLYKNADDAEIDFMNINLLGWLDRISSIWPAHHDYSIQHIGRSYNLEADALSKAGLSTTNQSWQVGPIPIDDDLGKEVITRFTTNIPSNKEFFTDSNGRDFLKRVRNYRKDWNLSVHELIAGNYYPLNLGIYLKDNETEFSLLVDRAVGGSSIFDGELELMLHRRLLHDDNKGVAENLNETVCFNNNRTCEGLTVQGKIYLSVNPVEKASEWRRTKGQRALLPLQISFATIPDGELNQIKKPKYSALAEGYELPPNVAILTLQELDDRQTLLRLAHLYEVEESAEFSKSATIDLYKLFPNHKVKKIVELNLSAVKEKSQMRRFNWKVEGNENTFPRITNRPAMKDGEHVIELSPFEIRTFQLEFDV